MTAKDDARDYPSARSEPIRRGGRLRDAAVDPRPEDYLAPVNAGKADPHGPEVVSPGIHGVGPVPLVPGEVAVDDTERQDAVEVAAAKAALLDGKSPSEQHKAARAASKRKA